MNLQLDFASSAGMGCIRSGVREADQVLMIFFVDCSSTYTFTDKGRDAQTQTACRQTLTNTHAELIVRAWPP